MKETFGVLPSGEEASLYTISCGPLTACVTDYGASLVKLFVPDIRGVRADVVLGYDNAEGYRLGKACLGGTVGRNANRIQGASYELGGRTWAMTPNEGNNNLHSGPDCFYQRMWKLVSMDASSVKLALSSPHGDQGFPGNAEISVTYTLTPDACLHVRYEAVSDRDTIFNFTNHSYFNLAGHDRVEAAMGQELTLPGRWFNPSDAENIPTGEQRPVAGTPMDFRAPKAISRDIGAAYEPLRLQNGYDHNWEAFCDPCAILSDPVSGRTVAVSTDRPCIQLYTGNFLDETGKGGVYYGTHTGVALETQFAPDSLHHPEWPQPITKAGEKYKSETVYRFSW